MKVSCFSIIAATIVISAPLSAQSTMNFAVGPVFPLHHLQEVASSGISFSFHNEIPFGTTPYSARILAAYSRFAFGEIPNGTAGVARPQKPAYLEITGGVQYEARGSSPIIPYAHGNWGYFHGEGSVPENLVGGKRKDNHLGSSVGGGLKFRALTRNLFVEARYVTISGGDQYVPVVFGVSF